MTIHHYDAIVVGARCAGATTAMLMAQKGMRVLLVERGAPGTDTLSSHNLTRGAVKQLVRWGLSDRLMDQGTPPITRTTFQFGETVLPLDVRPVENAPGLMGTRRAILDATLVDAAREAGADVRFHTIFRDVIRDENHRVAGAILTTEAGATMTVAAPLVVGADGIRSTVARRVGATVQKEATHALGHIYGYYAGLPLSENHAFFAPGVSVASTPTNHNMDIVIATTAPEALKKLRGRMDDESALKTLARMSNSGFADLLQDARLTEPVKVFAGAKGFVRNCAGAGWALVGDAGYFRDPVTAHGITDAFRDAELLANAAGQGDVALQRYQHDRNEVTAEIWEITDRIAAFDLALDDLQLAFQHLAHAMRAEQVWMANKFEPAQMAA